MVDIMGKKRFSTIICLLTYFFIFIVSVSIVKADYYLITASYYYGGLINKNLQVLEGEPSIKISEPETNYEIKLISFDEEILFSYKFKLSPTIFIGGKKIELNEFDFTLTLPYFANGKRIDIYDTNNRLLLSIDVSKFAKCDEDGICEDFENEEICPQDCQIFKPFKEKKKELINLKIMIIILFIVLISFVVIMSKKCLNNYIQKYSRI